MGKITIIVESPTKAKTIQRYLGNNYKVVSSVGHIRDLPKSKLGVDVEAGFEPDYQTIKGKSKTIQAIKSAIKDADEVYLASDPDREGEAIAWHIAQILNKPTKRIEFQEVTKKAVLEALKHPRAIDEDRVSAYHARRVLDRLVGYQISPLMWRKIKPGLSAGRVQSVAVRMICEREEEIRAFNPQEYWSFEGQFADKAGNEFIAALAQIDGQRVVRPEEDKREGKKGAKDKDKEEEKKAEGGKGITIGSEADAKALVADAMSQSYSASAINLRNHQRRPQPPFTTSTMQQDSARKLGWTARRTMQIAQQLYEGIDLGNGPEGLITYMRSDSVRVSSDAQQAALKRIENRYGKEYAPEKPNFYKSKGSAQEAHEAVRPTSIGLDPDSIKNALNTDQFKLYNLIYRRFVASQMVPARFETKSLDIVGGKYTFRASVTETVFKGFLAAYGDARGGDGENQPLPKLDEGDNVPLSEVKSNQHFTKPPPRFTDASLVKALEEHGIGRPSTYAPIIETIIYRNYVVRVNRVFEPTEWGFVVTEMMEHYFPNIVDMNFTREMEENLDKVEHGEIDWKHLMGEFYEPFKKKLEAAAEEKKYFKAKPQETEHKCDKCGSTMLLRHGKYGRFLACSAYPDCSNIKNIDDKGNIVDKPTSEAGQKVDHPCPKCKGELSVKVSRWGTKFIGCGNYPKCDYTSELQTQCPKCKADLHRKRLPNRRVILVCGNNETKDGESVGKCDFVCWGKPLLDTCDKCGFWIAEQKIKGTDRWRRYCPNAECPNYKGLGEEDEVTEEVGSGSEN